MSAEAAAGEAVQPAAAERAATPEQAEQAAAADQADQSAQAKQRTAELFDRASATYEDVDVDFFTRWGRRLVELSAIGPGDRVLDVGCGSGAVMLPAAEAVGATGRVTAIDLAPGMVRRCTELCRARALEHVEVLEGDAEEPPIDGGSFDAVLAGLLVFFLPDPDAALAAYRKALVPGGRLAFSTFGQEDERFRSVFAAIAAHAPSPPPSVSRHTAGDDDQAGEDGVGDGPKEGEPRIEQGPFQTVEGIGSLLARHGFGEVRIATESEHVRFDDPEHWIRWSWSHGVRAAWESVPEERLERAHADASAALQALAESSGEVVQRWTLRYTTAVRT